MTCMEVADMMVYEFTKRVIVPVVAAIFLAALFYPLCVENSVCDYLKLWVLMGIPFVPLFANGSETDFTFISLCRSRSPLNHWIS